MLLLVVWVCCLMFSGDWFLLFVLFELLVYGFGWVVFLCFGLRFVT